MHQAVLDAHNLWSSLPIGQEHLDPRRQLCQCLKDDRAARGINDAADLAVVVVQRLFLNTVRGFYRTGFVRHAGGAVATLHCNKFPKVVELHFCHPSSSPQTFDAINLSALEGLYAKQNGSTLELAEQQLVDCWHGSLLPPRLPCLGCNGGNPTSAMGGVSSTGIMKES